MPSERVRPDRRVARMRRSILAAFSTLVEDCGYQAVTIQDVIAAADVGRSTFYLHFRGKDDLILARLAELGGDLATQRASLPQSATASEKVLAFSLPMLQHGHQNRSVIRAMLADHVGRAEAMRSVESMLIDSVRRELETALPRGADRVRIDAQAHQIVGAFTRIFLWWIEDRSRRLDHREVHRMFTDLMQPGLTLLLAGR